MTFTDDDLKRLKDQVDRNDPVDNFTSIDKMKALLVRLEAAEKLAGHDHCGCYGRNELEATWRKAAGK